MLLGAALAVPVAGLDKRDRVPFAVESGQLSSLDPFIEWRKGLPFQVRPLNGR
jgi:hypothetical protein